MLTGAREFDFCYNSHLHFCTDHARLAPDSWLHRKADEWTERNGARGWRISGGGVLRWWLPLASLQLVWCEKTLDYANRELILIVDRHNHDGATKNQKLRGAGMIRRRSVSLCVYIYIYIYVFTFLFAWNWWILSYARRCREFLSRILMTGQSLSRRIGGGLFGGGKKQTLLAQGIGFVCWPARGLTNVTWATRRRHAKVADSNQPEMSSER